MSPEAFLSTIMSSDALHSLMALALGFAVAGLLSSGYQLLTERPASFRLINRGRQTATIAAVPFLIFAAPFIIMRNTLRVTRIEQRNFGFATLTTMIAGFWSLMSGTIVVAVIEKAAFLVA